MRRFAQIISDFRRRRDGVTAIETAFVLPVMITLTVAAMEVGFFFFRTAIINSATAETARPIRTGNAFGADFVPIDPEPGDCLTGRECFFEQVCARVAAFGDCSQNLAVEVKRFGDFTAAALDATPLCTDSADYNADETAYDPGDPEDIIKVRVCYRVKMLNPLLGIDLRQTGKGYRNIIAVSVFRNERYTTDEEDEEGQEGVGA
jgi:hypothetical protein